MKSKNKPSILATTKGKTALAGVVVTIGFIAIFFIPLPDGPLIIDKDVPLTNTWQYLEHKSDSNYSPNFEISKSPGDLVIEGKTINNVQNAGAAYLFIELDKEVVNGKKLNVRWHGHGAPASIMLLDGAYDLERDFAAGIPLQKKGEGELKSKQHSGAFSSITDVLTIDTTNSRQSSVTLMIMINDTPALAGANAVFNYIEIIGVAMWDFDSRDLIVTKNTMQGQRSALIEVVNFIK